MRAEIEASRDEVKAFLVARAKDEEDRKIHPHLRQFTQALDLLLKGDPSLAATLIEYERYVTAAASAGSLGVLLGIDDLEVEPPPDDKIAQFSRWLDNLPALAAA